MPERIPADGAPPRDQLWIDLVDMIAQKGAANPRNLQVELGPSEVGHPCVRKLAYGLMATPACNPGLDPLPSIIGVAMHTWLEGAAQYANEVLGYQRWITERRVQVTEDLFGTADLYDTETHTVIDWKNLGYTSYSKYTKHIGPTYLHQVMLYGKGYARLGYPVKQVAIAIIPRTGSLRKLHLERIDFDEALADAVIERRNGVIALLDQLDVEHHPERFEWIEKSPDACVFCDWWRPFPEGPLQCNGEA
jgi:hypothetical protein